MKEKLLLNRHILKTTIISAIILLFANSFIVANEKITITIDGKSYSKDIPEDYDSAVKLIKFIADLERNADLQYVEISKRYDDTMNSYENELVKLYDEINSLKSSLDDALNSANKTEKDIKKLTSVNSRFTMDLSIGPIFGFDTIFVTGMNVGIILDYRILKNFHIGGDIFLNTFTTQNRPFEFGAGLIIGYSLY